MLRSKPSFGFVGSPPVALEHVPFLPFGHDAALATFRVLAFVTMVGAVALTARAVQPGSRLPCALIGVGALLVSFPMAKTVALGQANGFVMLSLAAGVWACSREKWSIAGVGFGVATVLKVSPGLLVVYLLIRGRRRATAWAAATVAVLFAVSAAIGRPADTIVWITDVSPRLSRSVLTSLNQSIVGAAGRLTTHLGFHSSSPPGHRYLLGYALAIGCVAGLWHSRRGRPLDVLELGILVLVALLAGPLTWDHYVTWAFVPLVLIVDPMRWRGRDRIRVCALASAVAVSVLLLMQDVPVPNQATVQGDWWLRITSDRYTVSVALLLVVAVVLLPSRRADGTSTIRSAEVDQLPLAGADTQR
jgi:alpha-1,2-mannosyltransferase